MPEHDKLSKKMNGKKIPENSMLQPSKVERENV
jgi:hypothetical protein